MPEYERSRKEFVNYDVGYKVKKRETSTIHP